MTIIIFQWIIMISCRHSVTMILSIKFQFLARSLQVYFKIAEFGISLHQSKTGTISFIFFASENLQQVYYFPQKVKARACPYLFQKYYLNTLLTFSLLLKISRITYHLSYSNQSHLPFRIIARGRFDQLVIFQQTTQGKNSVS